MGVGRVVVVRWDSVKGGPEVGLLTWWSSAQKHSTVHFGGLPPQIKNTKNYDEKEKHLKLKKKEKQKLEHAETWTTARKQKKTGNRHGSKTEGRLKLGWWKEPVCVCVDVYVHEGDTDSEVRCMLMFMFMRVTQTVKCDVCVWDTVRKSKSER